MTALPDHVQVGAIRYTLAVDQAAINATGENRNTYGRSLHREQRILLSEGLGSDQQSDTVLHEVLHACLSVTGLNLGLEDEKSEALVYGLTAILLDVLRRNPKLVAYLMGAQEEP